MCKIIGIDFSMISTGLCVRDLDKNTYDFYWFPRRLNNKYPISNKAYNNISDVVKISPYEVIDDKDGCYTKSQINHLERIQMLTNNIIEVINKYENVCEIRLEGFSYNSMGSSSIDIIMYQSILRYILWSLDKYKIKFITPSVLKKVFTGKGNANKDLMIETFCEKKIDDLNVKSIQSSLNIKSNNYKPYDDLVDSFGLVYCDFE